MQIKILEANVTSFNWQDKKSGLTKTGYKQSGYAVLPTKPFPVEISLRLDSPERFYQPGVYQLAPESFYVDRFGSLAINPVLTPAKS